MNEIANRLRAAREAAGFTNASDCAARFGWKYATYAGHENGHRGIKLDTLRRYAAAFKVDVSWLLSGESRATKETAPPKALNGFHEPEVSPFRPQNAAEGKVITSTLAILAPGAHHAQIYRAQRDFACFSIIKGDLILIGTPLKKRSGDIVIATLSSPDETDIYTVLRQCINETLVPPAFSVLKDETSYSIGILGTVLAIVRIAQN